MLDRAAAKGTPRDQRFRRVVAGHQDIRPDFVVAMSWFLRGAEIGDSASMLLLRSSLVVPEMIRKTSRK